MTQGRCSPEPGCWYFLMVLNFLPQLLELHSAYERDQLRGRMKGLTSASVSSFPPCHWPSLVVNFRSFEMQFPTSVILCLAVWLLSHS